MTTRPALPTPLLIAIVAVTFFSVVVMNYIVSPILPAVAAEYAVTTSEAGQLVTVYGLLFAVSALLLGSLVEAFGHKRMIIGALVVFGIGTICTGLAPNFALMMMFRGLSGLAAAVVQTANWAVLANHVPYERRGGATGWVMQAGTLALLGGVPLGGWLATFVSWHAIFYAVGGLALGIAGLLVVSLPDSGKPGAGAPLREMSAGLTLLVRRAAALRAFSLSFLTWVAMFSFYTYLGSFLTEQFRLDAAQVSQMTLVLGFGYLFGGQAGGRLSDRIGRDPVIIGGLALMLTVFLVLPHVQVPAAALVLIALLGFGYFFSYSSQVTAITELMPERRGIGMAANYFVTYFGAALGAQVGGWVYASQPYPAVGLTAAAAAAAAMMIAARTPGKLWIGSGAGEATRS